MKKLTKPFSILMMAAMLGTGITVPYNVLTMTQQTAGAEAIETAAVTSIKALNPIALEVTFATPLPQEEIVLDQAQKNFQFDNGLAIRNIPQLKTGTKSTYIVPTTPQTAGTVYTLSYKGAKAVSFAANPEKISMRSAEQTSYDTFQIESSLRDGVTDYENIIAAQVGKRNGLDFVLDQNNQYKGKTYQIIPSLRGAQVTITAEGGKAITATYVPFTQATDKRQAPKFRLPEGESLQPGVKYTVSAPWATIKQATFTAVKIAPLTIQSVTEINETTLEVTLSKDPRDEVFASRRLILTALDGTQLIAQYKVQTRKGASGTFEILNGGKLAPHTSYSVAAVGQWAGFTFTTK